MKEMLRTLKTSSGLFLLLAIFCGNPEVVWQRVVDTGADEQLTALISFGDILIVIGNRENQAKDSCIGLLQWLDLQGNLLRRQTVAEGKYTLLRGASLFQVNNILLCGYTQLRDTTLCLIIRLGPDGRTIWKKGLAIGFSSWANDICLVDSNFAICGGVKGNGSADLFVLVLNPAGRTLWSKNYHFAEPTEGWKIASDPNGNLVVLGGFAQSEDILLLKLNSDGDTLWTRRYDSGTRDRPGGLALDRFGNIVCVGTAGDGDSVRCVILEYTPDGGVVRKVAYQENARAEGSDVFITDKGDIYVCATILTPKGRRILAFEYRPNARSVWERHIAAGSAAAARAILYNNDVFLAADCSNRTKDIAIFRLSR